MPEAPWLKRCDHGIHYADVLQKDGKESEKFHRFFNVKTE